MPILANLTKGRVPVKAWTADLEPEARRQLENVANLPIVHGHVAAMPDVHAGIGATVGSVIPTRRAIIPAAVGVDIGCGMNAVRLSLTAGDLPQNLGRIRSAIEATIPVGFDLHDRCPAEDAHALRTMARRLQAIERKHPGLAKLQRNFGETWARQLGTLGGGNHFFCIGGNCYEARRTTVGPDLTKVGRAKVASPQSGNSPAELAGPLTC